MIKEGYDVQYGARPLKRTIQKYVEDKIAEFIVNTEESLEGKTVTIDAENVQITVGVA